VFVEKLFKCLLLRFGKGVDGSDTRSLAFFKLDSMVKRSVFWKFDGTRFIEDIEEFMVFFGHHFPEVWSGSFLLIIGEVRNTRG
jgi:hypothetical protein